MLSWKFQQIKHQQHIILQQAVWHKCSSISVNSSIPWTTCEVTHSVPHNTMLTISQQYQGTLCLAGSQIRYGLHPATPAATVVESAIA
jgi:hypothetical protein